MTFRILDLAARLLFALGLGCLLLAGYLAWQSMSFAADAQRATGEVVSYHEVHDGDSMRYRPRVRFKTDNGDIITVEGQLTTTSQRFPIGTQIPMVYKTREPTNARIATFTDNWLGATIALVIGLVGIAGGVLVRRAVKREIAKTSP